MADHRARPRRLRSLWLAGLGLLLLVLLVRPAGTGAFWADDVPLEASSLTTGTFDVKIREGTSGTFTDTATLPAAALADMLPGDSRTFSLGVTNTSTRAPLSYQVLGRSTAGSEPGSDVLGNALRTEIWLTDDAASNPGSATTGYRTDQFGTAYGATCPAGPQVGPGTTLSVTEDVLLTSSATDPLPTLDPGEVSHLCVRVSLPDGVPGTAMGTTAAVTLRVVARSERP